MPRDKDLIYIGHMLDMARKAAAVVGGKDRAAYDRDETLQLALTHLLQMIGEAARRVSQEFRAAHPDVPWAAIVGMRHKVVHDYLSVDLDIVWGTVFKKLPPLVEILERIVPAEDGP